MYKLIISETRYDAILYASHLLDNRSVLITIADGMDEPNPYKFCWDAMREQRKFEVDKAYKQFRVRQLYCFNQMLDSIDYQFVLVKLQLMLAVSPFTHLCHPDGHGKLNKIYESVTGPRESVIYLRDPINKSFTYELTDEEMGRKLEAIHRMVTVRNMLLSHASLDKEYIKRMV